VDLLRDAHRQLRWSAGHRQGGADPFVLVYEFSDALMAEARIYFEYPLFHAQVEA